MVNDHRSSSSSLSSLSQLDEAVALAEQEIEKENRRENQFKLQSVAGSGRTGYKGGNSKVSGLNDVTGVGNYSNITGRKDSKAVKFDDMENIYDDAHSGAPAKKVNIIVAAKKQGNIVNGGANIGSEKTVNDRAPRKNSTGIILPVGHGGNPTRENGNYMNGSVNVCVNNPNPHVQNARQTVYPHTQGAHNGRHSPVQILVNGTETCNHSPPSACSSSDEPDYANKITGDSSGYINALNENSTNTPPPPPLSTLPGSIQHSEKKALRPTTIPIQPDHVPSGVVGSKPEFLSDVYEADGSQTGSEVPVSGSQPPPAPPPPPPPAPAVNGNGPAKNMEDIKKKSTSLPARFVFD